jgi:AraC family transcriptional regulator
MEQQAVIKNMPERKVIGMGAKFISVMSPEKNNQLVIPRLWQAYMQRQEEIKNRDKRFSLGLISAVLPVETKSHPYELYYMACAEVPDTNHIPAGMEAKTVPAGNYAVFQHHGPVNRIGETLNYIYQKWLPQSGQKIRKAPEIEIYDERFNPTSETSEMDICIPVE